MTWSLPSGGDNEKFENLNKCALHCLDEESKDSYLMDYNSV